MVADLQTRVERSSGFLPQSHQDLKEESGQTDGGALQKRSRRSNRPRTPGKKSIPLLNRIQMDQGECDDLRLKTRNTAQTEKSLIERIEIAPDDTNGQIYRLRQNGKLIDEHGSNRKKRRLGGETSTGKQVNSRQDFLGTLPRDDNVIVPNQDSTQGKGSASVHHIHLLPLENIPSDSVTPKSLLDHLLPLAQRIADVRMENSQVGTPPSNAAVHSSVITAEVLAQFSQQLINLRKELHHHQEDNGPHVFPIEETQISADNGENRSPLGASLNGHGHHPGVFEGTISHEPSQLGTKEHPQALRDVRTPTPEYREKGPPSSFTSPLPHGSPNNYLPDPSRRYSSSELRGTSQDFRRHGHRVERRSWDHYDYSSKSRREDPDHRYRRSISPKSRRTPYSSSTDRRNSSPPRYRNRRGSPLPHRQRPRSPLPPDRRRHSSEKSKDSIPRIHESVSNHVKESQMQANGMGSMSLQDLLRNYRGIASSQQGTRRVSELNVPGIWFAFQGSQEIGMSTIEFEFDEQTALKWNPGVQSNKSNTTLADTKSLQDRLRPSLELFCFSLNDVQVTMQKLSREVGSHDLVKALSSLENTWPPQGHLIVSINEESQNQKFWFPDTFRRKDSIKLEEFLHKGVNHVKFINLSDLSGKILVLLATPNGIQNDYTRLKFLLPESGGGASFQKATQTISKG